MCTNFQSLRRHLQERGNGDTSGNSLIQDWSFSVTNRESFFNKTAVISAIFIVFFLLSKMTGWAALVYDIMKPVYILYIGGSLLVELVSPLLRKFEAWLIDQSINDDEDYQYQLQLENFDSEHESDGELRSFASMERIIQTLQSQNNNNENSQKGLTEIQSKQRLHKSRRATSTGPTTNILRALESELRKERLRLKQDNQPECGSDI